MKNKKGAREANRAAELSINEGAVTTSFISNEHIAYADRKGRRVSHAEESARHLRPHIKAQVLDQPVKF